MPRRMCPQCPFRRDYQKQYDSVGVLMFIIGVEQDGRNECHMVEWDRECEGGRRFIEGGHPEVFGDFDELIEARSADTLAMDYCREMDRLCQAEVNQ